MISDDVKETEDSLNRVNKICRFISVAMKVIFVVFGVSWAVVTGIMALALVNPSLDILSQPSSASSLVLYLLHGITIAFGLVVLMKIFSDVAKGKTPFTMLQVKRLRLIAGILVIYAILDTLIATNTTALQFSSMNLGYTSTMDNTYLTVNFAPLIVSAVVFAFSFVFQYGILLQELSDDTV